MFLIVWKNEMKRKGLLFRMLILVILALSTVGCSRLVEGFFLQAEIADTGWVLSPDNSRLYKFQYEGVTVVVCPVNRWDRWNSQTVSLGPPLLPIIPTFESGERGRRERRENLVKHDRVFGTIEVKFKSNLKVQIGILSPTDISTIDFSKIRAEFPGGKLLPLSKISGFEEIKECPDPWGKKREQVRIEQIAIINKKMHFLLEFDTPLIDVEEFILDLGHLSVNDKNIKLPHLKYKEVSEYRYHPLFIPIPH